MPNFDLKNMISTKTKGLSRKKWINSQDFEQKNFKLLDFYDKFQQVARNILKNCLFYIHI
jgi:hypothetical protein